MAPRYAATNSCRLTLRMATRVPRSSPRASRPRAIAFAERSSSAYETVCAASQSRQSIMAVFAGSAAPRRSPRFAPRLRLVMCIKLAEQGPYYAEDDEGRTAGALARREAAPVARARSAGGGGRRHRRPRDVARGVDRQSGARLYAR